MYDEASLRRLAARLRQDLFTLPATLANFAELKASFNIDDVNCDLHELETAEFFARRGIEDAVHLLHALILSAPALAEMHAAFKSALPEDLLTHTPEFDIEANEQYFHFPAQAAVERFFDLGLAAVGGVISAERLEILDSICSGMGNSVARFIEKCWIEPPSKETTIKEVGFALLKAAFPDTEPDGGISFKLADGKMRKPDAAIPSLRVCIEFKYANDAAELGNRVDEIVADMSAYGDARYDSFRAVIFAPYEGAAESTLEYLMKERTKNVRPRKEWKTFLVNAAGGRRHRKPVAKDRVAKS
jgi:hypothetical protein